MCSALAGNLSAPGCAQHGSPRVAGLRSTRCVLYDNPEAERNRFTFTGCTSAHGHAGRRMGRRTAWTVGWTWAWTCAAGHEIGAHVRRCISRTMYYLPRRAPPAGRRSMLGTKLPSSWRVRGPTGARCLPQPECGLWRHNLAMWARWSWCMLDVLAIDYHRFQRLSSSSPDLCAGSAPPTPISDLSSAAGALARRGFRGRVLTLERRVLADSLLVKLPNVCERSGQLSKRIRGSARVLCKSHGRYAC